MKNKIRFISLLSLFSLSSCNTSYFNGELITKNTSTIISYINEYRINSNFEYLIPIESTSNLSKNDFKTIKLDDIEIKDYELKKISENSYKYYLEINSQKSYKKLNISLNNKEYEYYLNLINYNNDLFKNEYTFKTIDFNVSEDIVNNYKISYILNFKDDVSLFLDNSLNMNHPLFKGSAKLTNMDTGVESYSSTKKALLSKNTNYLLTISFEEDSSCYYFDEYIPFKVGIKENFVLNECYIFPQNVDNKTSKVLSKIF